MRWPFDDDTSQSAIECQRQQRVGIGIAASEIAQDLHFLAGQGGFAVVRIHRIEIDHVPAALLAQQAVVIVFGATALGLPVPRVPLLCVVVLAWTLTLVSVGAMLGLLASSLSALSACYDIGAMILSSLGGALVPLAVMPGWVRHIAPASPGYWAVSALAAALRGSPGRALTASAVLVSFAAGAALFAAARASRSWGRSARL